jgi:hypothetical protein
MHTVVVLSDAFGATYETLPGQFRQVKDPFPAPDQHRPISHLVAGWALGSLAHQHPRCRAWGVFERLAAEQRQL